MQKLPRNEQLHERRHRRKAGAHGGSRRPEAFEASTLRPYWCQGCGEVTVTDSPGDCEFCFGGDLEALEE